MNERIKAKIAKLVALAGQRDSIEEAAVAFEQAQRLAARYGLSLEDAADDAAESRGFDGVPPPPLDVQAMTKRKIWAWNRAEAWIVTLGEAVSRSHGCRIYQVRGQGGGIWAYGQPRDIDAAEYMLAVMTREIDAMAKRAARSAGGDRSWSRSYRMGVADAVWSRSKTRIDLVAAERAEVNERRRAAVMADEVGTLGDATVALARVEAAGDYAAQVEAALAEFRRSGGLGVKLRKGPRPARARSRSAYQAGREAGESLSMGGGKAALSS